MQKRLKYILLVGAFLACTSAQITAVHATQLDTKTGNVISAFRELLSGIRGSAPFLTQRKNSSEMNYNSVYAQSGGSGGGGFQILYYKTVSPGPPDDVSCPAGWADAYGVGTPAYGPHYVGVIAQGWYHTTIPTDDPPPDRPTEPTDIPVEPQDPENPPASGPGPGGPPPGGGGGGGGGGNGGPPPGGGGGGGGGGTSGGDPVTLKKGGGNFFSGFFDLLPTAQADPIPGYNYFVSSVAIGSDSVCSLSDKEVVPFSNLYNNTLYSGNSKLYSRACFTDASTGLTTCNRCRVCVK